MKILVLGHGDHGKDEFAEYLSAYTGLRYISSSLFACERAIWPHMQDEYPNMLACFEDRSNNRTFWKHKIRRYNGNRPDRLVKELLAEYDIYVGLRHHEEYEVAQHYFDIIYWVDASLRVGTLDSSLSIPYDLNKHLRIDNNGSKLQLQNLAMIEAQEINRCNNILN